MENALYNKIHAASIAGWWTLLVAFVFGLLQAGLFMLAVNTRPAWVTSLWAGMSWDTIQATGLWMMAIYRLLVWTLLLLTIFLTIWSARLRRAVTS